MRRRSPAIANGLASHGRPHCAKNAWWSAARLSPVRKITRRHSVGARYRKWAYHIPLNYVVTPRCSHSSLDLSIRYPHDVSSAPMAISTEGETWDKLPKRHEETAPSPSISKMNPPTFG